MAANQYQGGRGSFLFEAWICKDFPFCNDFNYLQENNVLLVTYLNYSNTTEILKNLVGQSALTDNKSQDN